MALLACPIADLIGGDDRRVVRLGDRNRVADMVLMAVRQRHMGARDVRSGCRRRRIACQKRIDDDTGIGGLNQAGTVSQKRQYGHVSLAPLMVGTRFGAVHAVCRRYA